ncbi:MAG: 50S ribosomal protein L9, partial [Actinomycetota bacterium]|nr:50S ribosomal protein L9 [Actinomycetota bacterium]
MKIVLRSDVANLGRKGDLVEVADGYARNYLVPKGLAISASKGSARQSEAMRRSRTVRDTKEREG